ncbi:hypothetical protein PROFUN_13587 [Planoprotostelium fungivorum]|uniref:Uncharacterized protein n=1 Tax=Planoprotostelium fungivorum TaxID=1890364 RepID=A0A2P6N3J2_9EUKA|nr:hypothetical protein PROFUN_13587 [Planoprotostelium fungivorum]
MLDFLHLAFFLSGRCSHIYRALNRLAATFTKFQRRIRDCEKCPFPIIQSSPTPTEPQDGLVTLCTIPTISSTSDEMYHLFGWHKILEKYIPGGGVKQVTKKLLIDQSLFSPYMLVANLGSVALLNGRSYEEINNKFRQDFKPTLIVNWMVWIPASAINFIFIPYPYRVLWANFVAFGWNSYLSIVSNRRAKPSLEVARDNITS